MKNEKRVVKVMFAKGGSGSLHTKLNVPITWIRAMGISVEEREVEILFDGEKITIQKKEKEEENEVKRIKKRIEKV
jgi:hypothetical protein